MSEHKEEYYSFTINGECNFIDFNEIQLLREKNMDIVLIVDSCVCLDIVNLINKKLENKDSISKKQKVLNLISHSQKFNLDIISLFSLVELSHKKETHLIDKKKFWNMKSKVDFASLYPYEQLKSGNFDYNVNYKITDNTEPLYDSIRPLEPLLLSTYCCLLKIRQLCKSGLNKPRAEINTNRFLNWSLNTFGVLMGIETVLAFNIFGGNGNDFRKMIGIDSNPQKAKSQCWASAWDILNARISTNNEIMSRFTGEKTYPIFITNDGELHKLLTRISFEFKSFNTITKSFDFIFSMDSDFKNFTEEFRKEINGKMISHLKNKKEIVTFDKQNTLKLVKALENMI